MYGAVCPLFLRWGQVTSWTQRQLRIEDISKTSVCPLARSVRKHLRGAGIEKGVAVVYSQEPVRRAEPGDVPGSMVFVPASAGLLMASYIVRQIIAET